jgi:membrane fusion protein, multidrug efflux system
MLLLRTRPGRVQVLPALLRWRRPVLVIVGLIAAIALYWEITSLIAYTGDAYVTSDLVAVAPQVTGRIVAVHVRDNQTVHRGDKLLTIDPVPRELAVAAGRAAVKEAHAKADADRDAVAAAQSTLDAATAILQYNKSTQARAAALINSGAESQQQLDAANEALRRADADADAARAALDKAREVMAIDQAAVEQAEAQLATEQWRLSKTNLPSPTDGTITHLTVRVGDTARDDVPMIGIVDAHAWRVIANYKQIYLRAFRPGGTAWVWLDSKPWHWYRARIEGVAAGISRTLDPPGLLPYVAPTTDWIRLPRRFPVTLILIKPPPDLQLFMGADARVVIFP